MALVAFRDAFASEDLELPESGEWLLCSSCGGGLHLGRWDFFCTSPQELMIPFFLSMRLCPLSSRRPPRKFCFLKYLMTISSSPPCPLRPGWSFLRILFPQMRPAVGGPDLGPSAPETTQAIPLPLKSDPQLPQAPADKDVFYPRKAFPKGVSPSLLLRRIMTKPPRPAVCRTTSPAFFSAKN